MQIAIVDTGTGNLRSVQHALSCVATNADILVTNSASAIAQADRVILPGQGAIGSWYKAIESHELRPTIMKAINEKPILAICVGMQALFAFSEEDGGCQGLGIFDGSIRHFTNTTQNLKIPHMGWNQVWQKTPHSLWQGIDDGAYFYFVHSYRIAAQDTSAKNISGTTVYGTDFVSVAAQGNVFAVQFHPEKSHNDGLQLLKNFSQWQGAQN